MVHILVVDDAQTKIVGDTDFFARQGFSLDKAPANCEVVAEAAARRPDIVLLNVASQGISGIEACRRLKAEAISGSIPVILFTLQHDPLLSLLASDAGAQQCITLPKTDDFLVQQFRSALASPGRQRKRTKKNSLLVPRPCTKPPTQVHRAAERKQYVQRLEEQIRQQSLAVRLAHEEIIERLVSAAACRDVETAAHLRRIGLLSGMLARAAGWTSGDVELIRLAAPMHDVGKVGIPDSVIRKPGRLTPEEFGIMKMHTTIGANMLDGSEFPLLRMAREIVLFHHERFNGSGYPGGLTGDAIPESARIVAIVDAYDSITHRRVYRPAMTEDVALCILSGGHGTEFDPRLLDLFFEQIDEVREIIRLHPDDPVTEEQLVASLV